MIQIDEKRKVFLLSTRNTSYMFSIFFGIPKHLYWGKKINMPPELDGLCSDAGFLTCNAGDIFREDGSIVGSTGGMQQEFAVFGDGDMRTPGFHGVYADGSSVSCFRYRGHRLLQGKPGIPGLPAVYTEKPEEAQTLEVELHDDLTGVSVFLVYSVLEEYDAITRSMRVENLGAVSFCMTRAFSCVVDSCQKDMDMITFPGAWANERSPQREALHTGVQEAYSMRGASSLYFNPGMVLARKGTDELNGDCYGFNLVYSGNFVAGCDVDSFACIRAYIGIHPMNFSWNIQPGQVFHTPEAVLVYSDCGLSGMSRIYHRLYRERLCRGKFRDSERYILLNNWEATYFNFTDRDIINIARQAKECNIDLMVVDDGWFGKRNDSSCSLGDWVENREKLPEGLEGLSAHIRELGMRFGLWFEPEMISVDSDLYRAHPDWCIHVNGRTRTESRNQLMLDLSRKDVCDWIVETLSDVLRRAQLSYVKWDYNRNMSQAGSALLPPEAQGEFFHRYVLGLYSVMETLLERFPGVLFEGCSAGGGRFDAGMLHYVPQIWTSDDSDAVERTRIQYGTSFFYPYSAMGAHVSAVPNHQTGRVTPLETRCNVAIAGQFGYELDLNKLTEEERDKVREMNALYRKIGPVFHDGEIYRLVSPFEHRDYTATEFVSRDGETVAVVLVVLRGAPTLPEGLLCLAGLDKDSIYVQEGTGRRYYGDALMQMGMPVRCNVDYNSKLLLFRKEK